MHEELMKEYGVPSTAVPILVITDRGKQIAKIVPRGLWIIGLNGRLDLYSGSGHFIVLDRAPNFSPPDWHIAPAEKRRELQPMAADILRKVLAV